MEYVFIGLIAFFLLNKKSASSAGGSSASGGSSTLASVPVGTTQNPASQPSDAFRVIDSAQAAVKETQTSTSAATPQAETPDDTVEWMKIIAAAYAWFKALKSVWLQSATRSNMNDPKAWTIGDVVGIVGGHYWQAYAWTNPAAGEAIRVNWAAGGIINGTLQVCYQWANNTWHFTADPSGQTNAIAIPGYNLWWPGKGEPVKNPDVKI